MVLRLLVRQHVAEFVFHSDDDAYIPRKLSVLSGVRRGRTALEGFDRPNSKIPRAIDLQYRGSVPLSRNTVLVAAIFPEDLNYT